MIQRYVIAVALGGIVTFGLFYLMQWLIAMDAPRLGDEGKGHVIEFVRLKRESELQTKDRKMPDKRPPPEPPPPPDLSMLESDKPTDDVDAISIDFDMQLDGGIGVGAVADSEEVPLVRIEPTYPERAAQRGIEGWVVVEFAISPQGSVRDPRVVDSSSSIFHRSALRAVRKWKYNPKVVDGKAVERPGVRTRLVFELEEEQKKRARQSS